MFGNIVGNFVGGVLWGVGATLVGQAAGGAGQVDGEQRMRDVAKGAVKAYLLAADRVQEVAEDIRRGVTDVIAEAEAEARSQRGAAGSATRGAGGTAATGVATTIGTGRTTARPPRPNATA